MMSNRTRQQQQKLKPIKATLPISSIVSSTSRGTPTKALSPQRHISPEHAISISGHRSPGAMTYKGKFITQSDTMRRTTSLDGLYMRSSTWNTGPCTLLQLDKATQTDESYIEKARGVNANDSISNRSDTPTEIIMEKVIRQRLQRTTHRGAENSVSSQTLSPIHSKASPVLIPPRNCPPIHMRPMRNSVEGLNQEIEKLVLHPGQSYSGRGDIDRFSRGTPEGHRAPLGDLFHDTRNANTQTPNHLSSDESQSTSPEEGAHALVTSASPRINRFLAREPPDGCEKVNLKQNDTDAVSSTSTSLFKPCVGFLLKPSLGSAFQPLQRVTPEAVIDIRTNVSEQNDSIILSTQEITPTTTA